MSAGGSAMAGPTVVPVWPCIWGGLCVSRSTSGLVGVHGDAWEARPGRGLVGPSPAPVSVSGSCQGSHAQASGPEGP
eukprot:2153937-Lingulodinium_polyedra.AAC.1